MPLSIYQCKTLFLGTSIKMYRFHTKCRCKDESIGNQLILLWLIVQQLHLADKPLISPIVQTEPRREKTCFCTCEIRRRKSSAQNGNRATDQRLCFRFIHVESTILQNCKRLAIICGCTAWFLSDLVGYSEVRFTPVPVAQW